MADGMQMAAKTSRIITQKWPSVCEILKIDAGTKPQLQRPLDRFTPHPTATSSSQHLFVDLPDCGFPGDIEN